MVTILSLYVYYLLWSQLAFFSFSSLLSPHSLSNPKPHHYPPILPALKTAAKVSPPLVLPWPTTIIKTLADSKVVRETTQSILVATVEMVQAYWTPTISVYLISDHFLLPPTKLPSAKTLCTKLSRHLVLFTLSRRNLLRCVEGMIFSFTGATAAHQTTAQTHQLLAVQLGALW